MSSPKLSLRQVHKIKTFLHDGMNAVKLAKKYKVTVSAIRSIHTGKHYPNVLTNLTRKARVWKKITPEYRAKVLKALAKKGATLLGVAREFNEHETTIRRIRNRNLINLR